MGIRPQKNVQGMAPYVPGEQPRDSKFIKLNTNENPYPPAAEVVKAVRAATNNSLRLYPDPLFEELCQLLARRHKVRASSIIVGNGSDEVLRLLCHAYLGPGDKVAALYPTYTLYDTFAQMFGARLQFFPTDDKPVLPKRLFKPDKFKIIFIASPNTPFGTSYDSEEIDKLCGRQPRSLIVIDEAYVDFAATNSLTLLKSRRNIAITRSLSKSYSLAGLRIGYCLAPEPIIQVLYKIKDSYNVNRLSQVAAIAALRANNYYRKIIKQIIEERERLRGELIKLGIEVPESQANFLFARLGEKRAKRVYSGLKRKKILVRYFPARIVNQGIRITIGKPEENAIFLKELKKLL